MVTSLRLAFCLKIGFFNHLNSPEPQGGTASLQLGSAMRRMPATSQQSLWVLKHADWLAVPTRRKGRSDHFHYFPRGRVCGPIVKSYYNFLFSYLGHRGESLLLIYLLMCPLKKCWAGARRALMEATAASLQKLEQGSRVEEDIPGVENLAWA